MKLKNNVVNILLLKNMKLIKLNPKTPGTRHQIKLSKNLLSKNNKIFKNLNIKINQNFGRSSKTGHITVRHHGSGCKKKYRNINFLNFNLKIINIMTLYDPFRNAFISLSFDYLVKKFYYLLASSGTIPGSILVCKKKKVELFFGNRTLLLYFNVGNFIYNINTTLKGKAKFTRAAGTYAQVLQNSKDRAQIRLTSGKILTLNANFYGSLGRVSNSKFNLTVLGKAGKNRLKGFRPTVRGVAMNPVDHPHGGKTKGGRPSVSPWGKLTKGKPTVKKYE